MMCFVRIAAAIIGAVAALPVAAQNFPAKPVRIVVPWPPGGANDIVGRTVMQRVAQTAGQQFIIDNRAGAGGVIGADFVAKSPADGYTVMVHSTSHVANAHLHKALPYDTARDFATVGLLAATVSALVVHPSLPVKTVKDLIALNCEASRGCFWTEPSD